MRKLLKKYLEGILLEILRDMEGNEILIERRDGWYKVSTERLLHGHIHVVEKSKLTTK